jgi:hypothetical protein
MLEISQLRKLEIFPEEVSKIFGNLDAIYTMSRHLIGEIRQKFDTWDSGNSTISDIFLKHVCLKRAGRGRRTMRDEDEGGRGRAREGEGGRGRTKRDQDKGGRGRGGQGTKYGRYQIW